MLSVVLTTHNEEKKLPTCLESIQDIADEIVIVDGESSDDTLKIAKKFNSKIIQTTNKKNFHINKQMAIDHATMPLILQLDADEVVDQELKQFIIKLKKRIKKSSEKTVEKILKKGIFKNVAWQIKRKNYFLKTFLTKGGQYPDLVMRLFLKDQAFLPQKNVHEQMEVKGAVGEAQGHLLHYSYLSFEEYLKKSNRYTSFQANLYKKEGLKINCINTCNYMFVKPMLTFLSLYIRHKGFLDGLAGFVFAWYSGLFHQISYLKYWELDKNSHD